MSKEQSVMTSSSDSIDDHLTAEKDVLVLQLEAANAKIETITAEKEKYRLDAEKYKAMNNNNNKENGDGDTIAQLQLEIEGLKQKLARANSQIATISDEKTSLITKMASILEPELAKLSQKQDFALDDQARSSIGGLKEDSTIGDDDSSSSTAAGASTNNNEPQSKARSNQEEVLGSMMTKLTMSDVK